MRRSLRLDPLDTLLIAARAPHGVGAPRPGLATVGLLIIGSRRTTRRTTATAVPPSLAAAPLAARGRLLGGWTRRAATSTASVGRGALFTPSWRLNLLSR